MVGLRHKELYKKDKIRKEQKENRKEKDEYKKR